MGLICPYTNKEISYTYCRECDDQNDCRKMLDDNLIAIIVLENGDFENYDFLKTEINKLTAHYKEVLLVMGGDKKIDKLAKRYAKEKGCEIKMFPENGTLYKEKARDERDLQMYKYISLFKNKGVVVFSHRNSEKYDNLIDITQRLGIPVRIREEKEG